MTLTPEAIALDIVAVQVKLYRRWQGGYTFNDASPVDGSAPGNRIHDSSDMSVQSDTNGHFIFQPIPDGTDTLNEVYQSGWAQTLPDVTQHTIQDLRPGQGEVVWPAAQGRW